MLRDFYGMEHTMTCGSEGRVIHVLLSVTKRGWVSGVFLNLTQGWANSSFGKKYQYPPALPTQEKTYLP